MPVQKGRSRLIALASLAVLLLLVGSASAAKVNYIYDELSRLVRVEYPDGTVIKYEYDKLGNRTYTEMLKNGGLTLTVVKAGVSSGIAPVIYSVTPGINCGDFCEGVFSGGADVTLRLLPGSDYELTGWSGGGCSGTGDCTVTMDANKTVTASFALLPPAADFTASPRTVNEMPVSFTDMSRGATEWHWEFGDGFASTEQNPTHVYPSTGTYTVSLTIRNSNSGLISTVTKTDYITVTALSCSMPMQPVQIDKPSAYFNTLQEAYDAAENGAVIKVHALTLLGDLHANDDRNKSITLIGGYQCDFSGVVGKTAVLGSITIDKGTLDIGHIDIFTGTSPVVYHQIHASSDTGGSISPSGTVSVAHGGSATYAIIPDQYYAIDKVLVDGTSVGAVDRYEFHGVTASHVIEAKFVKVANLPVADFTASPRTIGAGELSLVPVSFADTSLRAETWSWDFGDGHTSTEQYPIHTYSNVSAATYTVSLTVSNATGTDTKTVANYITVLPYENFSVQIDKPSVMYFSTLQAAYDAAADGAIIKAVASTLLGDLIANPVQSKTVTLIGGFTSDYSQQIGSTALLGSITISNGVLDIRDIELITGISQYYSIAASSDPGGSISPDGETAVAEGGNKTFTITPDQDHHIADVLVNGVSVGARTTHTFINVAANQWIEAKFARNEYTISTYAGTGGTISPSGISNMVTVPFESSQVFTITPDSGYHIVDVKIDGSSIGALVTSYTFSNVTSDHLIEATFSDRYTLDVLKTGKGGGSITSEPAGIDCGGICRNSLVPGSTITLTASPRSDSLFGGWSGDCSGTSSCVVTLNSDIVVTATFNLAAPPVANFSGDPTRNIRPVTVNFHDLSTEEPTSWSWNFGDNLSSSNTSTLKNPIHTYRIPGKYTVTLTATNAGGSNTMTITNYVVVHPYVKMANSTALYNSIQEAYNAAQNGETIQVLSSQALTGQGRDPLLVEDLVAAIPKTITLEGGYGINVDGGFESPTGMTTIKGSITTTTGNLIIRNIDLRTGDTYPIYASATGGGSISPSGTVMANPNSTMTFDIVPQLGYRIQEVWVDGNPVGALSSYSFTGISGNHTIEVQFTNSDSLPAPLSLSVTPFSPTRLDLAWIYNSTTETGFIIDRKTGIDGIYNQISSTGPGVTVYSDTGLVPDTVYYYRVRAINAVGSSEYSLEAGTTTPDTAPPTGSILIANGAELTNNPAVTLSLNSQDDSGRVTSMQFSNDNITWSAAETYATTKSWTLTAGDGTNTVYVKYKDNAGNWSMPYSSSITLDTTQPVTTASPVGGLYNSALSVTLVSNETGTIYYTTDGTTPSTASAVYSGVISPPANTTTTLLYFAKDTAGNSETVKTQTYIIDTLPPTGTISIASGATYTTGTAVTLTLSASDTNGVSQMQFSNDNVIWSAVASYATTTTWTLAEGDGTKTVYARYMDNAGNWTTVAITDTIVLDTTTPTGTVAINGGATYATSTAVTLTLSAADANGVSEMQFSNDDMTWSAVANYATTTSWTLSPGDGTKTVYARFKDSAGNWTNAAITATIVLDTTVPVGLWHMDGNWTDASGNGHNGTGYNEVTFSTNARVGSQSGSFDGVNDWVGAASQSITSAPNTFTIALWVYPTATRTATVESISGYAGTSNQRYAVAPDNGGTNAAAGISVGTNGISVFEHGANYLPSLLVYNVTLSGWNHIVVVYENKQPRLYLNGVLVKTGLTSPRPNVYPSALFGNVGNYGPYKGLIDEVGIYNRALTVDEISRLQ